MIIFVGKAIYSKKKCQLSSVVQYLIYFIEVNHYINMTQQRVELFLFKVCIGG